MTGHFTSYENRTDHKLTTGLTSGLDRLARTADARMAQKSISATCTGH